MPRRVCREPGCGIRTRPAPDPLCDLCAHLCCHAQTYVQPKWFEHVTKMKAQAELLKNLHNPKRPVQALHLFSSVQAYPALVEEGLEAAPEFLCLSLRNFRCYQGATRITIDRTITLPVANGTMATYTLAGEDGAAAFGGARDLQTRLQSWQQSSRCSAVFN